MPLKTFEGKLVSQNVKVGIVAARFNEFITSKLLRVFYSAAVSISRSRFTISMALTAQS